MFDRFVLRVLARLRLNILHLLHQPRMILRLLNVTVSSCLLRRHLVLPRLVVIMFVVRIRRILRHLNLHRLRPIHRLPVDGICLLRMRRVPRSDFAS